ncbi:MAG TPA: phosphotransferase [Thermoleophilaceae bacterium]
MEDSTEHRGDAVFALPRKPAAARLYGELPGWRTDLLERGIEVAADGAPELAVASAERSRDALASGAPNVIVDASRSAAGTLRRTGLRVRRLLPIPIHGSPALYLNLDQRAAARYGIASRGTTTGQWRLVRDRLASAAAASGILARAVPAVAVGTRSDGVPALLHAASELGVPDRASWNMVVSPGSAMRRNAFLIFAPGSKVPDFALKFSRVPELTIQFEREERGVAVARAIGGSVASAAPTYMGRVEVQGHHGALESAARGVRLATLLRGPAEVETKLRAVEQMVAWLERVSRETASPPATLSPERDRIAREVLPQYADQVDAGFADQIPPIPSVFCHNDPSEENVVLGSHGLTVLDWEWAQSHGLPLADLVYFGTGVLRILDGANREEDRAPHFVELMQGRAASSQRMFSWVARLSRALEVPPEAVGPVVTLGVLEHGHASRRERHRFERATGAALAPALAERTANAWLSAPGLGPAWEAWR